MNVWLSNYHALSLCHPWRQRLWVATGLTASWYWPGQRVIRYSWRAW